MGLLVTQITSLLLQLSIPDPEIIVSETLAVVQTVSVLVSMGTPSSAKAAFTSLVDLIVMVELELPFVGLSQIISLFRTLPVLAHKVPKMNIYLHLQPEILVLSFWVYLLLISSLEICSSFFLLFS